MIHVEIYSFQSIDHIEFDIDGYTVLTGPTGVGKSAICRAVEAALFNRRGDDFIRKGSKQSKVKLSFNGHTIEWVKGSGANDYYIDGKKFEKVGQTVPEDIQNFGFKDIELGKDKKLRPQMGTDQFGILFLVRESGPNIAELFSILTKLDVISKAGKDAANDLRLTKGLLKTRQDDLFKLEQKIIKYIDFDNYYHEAQELTGDLTILRSAQSQIQSLKDNMEKKLKLYGQVTALSPIKGVTLPDIPVDSNVKAVITLKNVLKMRTSLHGVIDSFYPVSGISLPVSPDESNLKAVKVLREIKSCRDLLVKYDNIRVGKIDFPNPPDYNLFKGIRETSWERGKLLQEISTLRSGVGKLKLQIKETHTQKCDLLKGMRECPICDQPLKNEAILA